MNDAFAACHHNFPGSKQRRKKPDMLPSMSLALNLLCTTRCKSQGASLCSFGPQTCTDLGHGLDTSKSMPLD
eukprot:6206228-Pleurochrysis_carterae.AAC.2